MKMKLTFGFLLFALVGSIYAATLEERFIGKPLPGLSDITHAIRKATLAALSTCPDLTDEQREQLVRKVLDRVNNFANENNIDSLKPSQVAEYIRNLRKFVKGLIEEVVAEAKSLVNDKDARAIGIPLPGIKDKLDELRALLDAALDKVTGLTSEQRHQLVREYLQCIKDFPNANGITVIRPSEIKNYIDRIFEYAKNLVKALCAKAEALVKGITSGSSSSSVRQARFLPGIQEVINFLEKKLDEALYRITGLTKAQHLELVDEFMKQMENFPIISGWDLLKPDAVLAYIKELRTFGQNVIDALIVKAKAFAEANKNPTKRQLFGLFGGGKGESTAPQFGALEYVENLIKGLYDQLVGTFLKSLAKINGLTQEQIDDLEKEFRSGLDQFPRPPLSEFYNPLKWINWSKKVTDHAFSLTEKLLHQARLLVNNILNKLPQEEYEKRDLFGIGNWAQNQINNVYDRLTKTFVASLRRIEGVTDRHIAQLELEFRNGLRQFTKPPTGYNVKEWANWAADVTDKALKLAEVMVEKARDAANNIYDESKGEAGKIVDELGNIVDDFEKDVNKVIDDTKDQLGMN